VWKHDLQYKTLERRHELQLAQGSRQLERSNLVGSDAKFREPQILDSSGVCLGMSLVAARHVRPYDHLSSQFVLKRIGRYCKIGLPCRTLENMSLGSLFHFRVYFP
jgi:hypothetical protein